MDNFDFKPYNHRVTLSVAQMSSRCTASRSRQIQTGNWDCINHISGWDYIVSMTIFQLQMRLLIKISILPHQHSLPSSLHSLWIKRIILFAYKKKERNLITVLCQTFLTKQWLFPKYIVHLLDWPSIKAKVSSLSCYFT